jgi:hypothetical protein
LIPRSECEGWAAEPIAQRGRRSSI